MSLFHEPTVLDAVLIEGCDAPIYEPERWANTYGAPGKWRFKCNLAVTMDFAGVRATGRWAASIAETHARHHIDRHSLAPMADDWGVEAYETPAGVRARCGPGCSKVDQPAPLTVRGRVL